MTEEVAEAAAKTMSDFKAAGGDAEGIEITVDPAEAEKVSGTCGLEHGAEATVSGCLTLQVSRIMGARAVYAWDASTLYPWKLGERLCPRDRSGRHWRIPCTTN
jgi:hypothetical protein